MNLNIEANTDGILSGQVVDGSITLSSSEPKLFYNSIEVEIVGKAECSWLNEGERIQDCKNKRQKLYVQEKAEIFRGGGIVQSKQFKVSHHVAHFDMLPAEGIIDLLLAEGQSKLCLKAFNDGTVIFETIVQMDNVVGVGPYTMRNQTGTMPNTALTATLAYFFQEEKPHLRIKLHNLMGIHLTGWFPNKLVHVSVQALSPNVLELPFSFRLPEYLPSSTCLHSVDRKLAANVEYYLQCKVDGVVAKKLPFKVLHVTPSLEPLMPVEVRAHMVLYMLVPPWRSETINLEAKLEHDSYYRGDTVLLQVNTSCTHRSVITENIVLKILLQRAVMINLNESGKEQLTWQPIGEELSFPHFQMNDVLTIPLPATLVPSFADGAKGPVAWNYQLVVTAKYAVEGALTSHAKIRDVVLPLKIRSDGTQSFEEPPTDVAPSAPTTIPAGADMGNVIFFTPATSNSARSTPPLHRNQHQTITYPTATGATPMPPNSAEDLVFAEVVEASAPPSMMDGSYAMADDVVFMDQVELNRSYNMASNGNSGGAPAVAAIHAVPIGSH